VYTHQQLLAVLIQANEKGQITGALIGKGHTSFISNLEMTALTSENILFSAERKSEQACMWWGERVFRVRPASSHAAHQKKNKEIKREISGAAAGPWKKKHGMAKTPSQEYGPRIRI